MKITLSDNNKKLNFGYAVFQTPKELFWHCGSDRAATGSFVLTVNNEFEKIHHPSPVENTLPLLAKKKIGPVTFLKHCGYEFLQDIVEESEEGKLWLKENSSKFGIKFPFLEETDNENYKFTVLDKDENALYLNLQEKGRKNNSRTFEKLKKDIKKWNLEHENEIDNIKASWLRLSIISNFYQDLFNSTIGKKPPAETYILKSLKELQETLQETLTVLKWKK